jgi:type I restriction enzyme S subunit
MKEEYNLETKRVLPKEWILSKLGDFLDYIQPAKYITNDIKEEGAVPVLTANKAFILGYTNETENVFSETPVIIFDDFTTDSKFVNFPFKVRSSALKILTPRTEKIDIKYLFESLKSIEYQCSEHKRYWISEFQFLRIPIPPLPEQQKIAEILSTVDDKIDVIDHQIRETQDLKKGLMQRLLTKGIGHTEFKDSPLGEIPESWGVVKFDDIIIKIDSGWSPNCNVEAAEVGEWGSLKTTSVTWDGYNPNENKKLPDTVKPRTDTEVKLDDILITRVGPRERVGVVVHVNDSRKRLMVSDNMLRLNIKKGIHLPFLEFILGSPMIQLDWKRKIAGLAEAQVVINQKIIKNTFVPIPLLEEQERIADIFIVVRKKIQILQLKKEHFQDLKKGLMQQLLTGKIRVNGLIDNTPRHE